MVADLLNFQLLKAFLSLVEDLCGQPLTPLDDGLSQVCQSACRTARHSIAIQLS